MVFAHDSAMTSARAKSAATKRIALVVDELGQIGVTDPRALWTDDQGRRVWPPIRESVDDVAQLPGYRVGARGCHLNPSLFRA
jgi:hypothetical protein